MEIDRLATIKEIRESLNRHDDEFTQKELSQGFGVRVTNLFAFMERNEIKYEFRKAIVDGRRQFVYRIEKDTK